MGDETLLGHSKRGRFVKAPGVRPLNQFWGKSLAAQLAGIYEEDMLLWVPSIICIPSLKHYWPGVGQIKFPEAIVNSNKQLCSVATFFPKLQTIR